MKKVIKKNIIAIITMLTIVLLTSCIRYHYNSNVDLGKYLGKIISELYDTTDSINSNGFTASHSNISENIENNIPHDQLTSFINKVETLSEYPLPMVNEVLYGFRVNGIYDYSGRNAKIVEFEHVNTGAKVLLISNDDIDKSVCLGFNTLTSDDRGIPHVFEHATLAGSKKYHGSNLFFDMSNKTYTTFLNAFTSQFSTCYPIGSLSDEQLFSCYKVYLDGTLKPEILNDDKILAREGYRYILSDKNDEFKLSGVVYSEMAAHESNIYSRAIFNANKTLLKGSVLSSITGGVTTEIPKIKHDDLIEFHNSYYHPSNMVITLYGDLDYKKYLEYTNNEYFANYDKIDINKDDINYQKNNSFVEKKYDFPVASNSTIDNNSIIVYSILCDGMSAYETGLFSIIINELQRDDGPLSREVSDKLYKAMFYIDNSLASPKPNINIIFQNVNEDDKDIIKQIVENALKEISKNIVSDEILNSFIDNNEMTKDLERDSHGFANQMTDFYYYVFMNNGNSILGYFEYLKGLDDLKDRYNDGTLKELVNRYFSTNANSALTITVPKPGLLESNIKSLNKYLEEYKLSLSDDEIKELILKNNEYNKWVEDSSKYSDIDKIRVVNVSSLSEYKAKCYAYEENVEGIRFIRSDIDNINYSALDILFDVSGIKLEDVHKLKLLSNLFLYLPTKNYPDFTLSAEFAKNTYTYGTSMYINHYWNGGYKPYFNFSIMTLNKNIDKAFELLKELMYKTEFDDINKLRNFINQEYNDYLTSINSNPSIISDNLIKSKIDSSYEYNEYLNGIEYVNFLKKIINYNDDELKTLLYECESLLNEIYNKDGLVCEIISDFSYINTIKKKVLGLTSEIKDERIIPLDYTEKIHQAYENTAVILNTKVQYNNIGIPFKENGIEFDSRFYIIDTIVDNKILYPEFRVKRSCYGAYLETSRNYSYIYTYRDPGLKASYDAFNEIPNAIKNMKITEDEFEDYKLSAYSEFSYPLTKLGSATIAIDEIFTECNEKRPERFIKYMRQIKDAKLSELKELKNRFATLIEKGIKVSVGSREQIEENEELFDAIINDYLE